VAIAAAGAVVVVGTGGSDVGWEADCISLRVNPTWFFFFFFEQSHLGFSVLTFSDGNATNAISTV
jgi:hypothetical protein